jgi:hypothetical protein
MQQRQCQAAAAATAVAAAATNFCKFNNNIHACADIAADCQVHLLLLAILHPQVHDCRVPARLPPGFCCTARLQMLPATAAAAAALKRLLLSAAAAAAARCCCLLLVSPSSHAPSQTH